MVTPDAPRPDHSVELTGLARAQLRAIARHAIYRGSGRTITDAFREVLAKLTSDPRGFGSPMYRLRSMRMDVFNAVVRPLYVEFGIHDQAPVVVIRYVAALTEPPAGS